MTKIVALLVAFLTVVQVTYGGVPRWDRVTKIGKYTRDLTDAIKSETNDVHLSYLREGVEKLIDVLNERHVEDDDTVLELKNKLHDLLINLNNSHRLVENLDEVWRIIRVIFQQPGERQRVEVHRVLVEAVDEYGRVLEHTILTKNNDVDEQDELERALIDTIDNLKTVSFDDGFVKRTLTNLINNYVKEVGAIPELDCLKTVVDATSCFENLLSAVKEGRLDYSVHKRLLPSTRALEFNIYMMCHVKVPLGETSNSFEIQIRTVANGLINAINSISVDGEETRNILHDLVREFVSEIEEIKDKLRTRRVITRMNVNDLLEATDVESIKSRLITAVQETTMEMITILRRKLTGDVYGVINDFIAVLQRQTMQIQNIYQSVAYKLPLEKLAMQVQTITNGVLLYLRNVPTNDIMIREKLEVQVHHLVRRVQTALNRVRSNTDEDFSRSVRNLMSIVEDFENFMEKTHMTSIQAVVFHFNILAQKIVSELRQLTWVIGSKNSPDLTDVVRNLLSEYLVIIENIQVKIQRINQVAQVGESPKELALQIQVTSEHLRQLLVVFVTDNRLTKNMLTWQARCFNQVLELIVEQLEAKTVTESGGIYHEVAANLKKMLPNNFETVDIDRLRVIVGKASMELNRLTLNSQGDIQEGHGVQTTFVRSLLLDFLLALQDFHIQVQHNFQIVLSGQSPMKILREIAVLTNKILQQPDVDVDVLAMQLGEYTQTIENVLNLLHHRMENNGEHEVEQEKIADVLGKMSLILQNVNIEDVHDVKEKLEITMRKFIATMQELVSMNMNKVKLMQVGSHTGILHGALSNMLTTMRNMYLQMQRAPENGNVRELLNKIAMIGNNIMPALETIVGSTTPIKQALNLQVFKYTRELDRILKKLIASDPKIKINIQEALMVLEQTATSSATLTINEIKLHFNKLIQGVGNEVQKIDKRELLVEYLMVLKNLHLQIQTISRTSHQSENYQLVGMLIDTAVIELYKTLQYAPAHNKILAKSIVLECRELAQLIANVINRYQAASVSEKNALFMQIASELKTIQLRLQETTVRNMYERFETHRVATDVERASILIEELMWTPVPQTPGSQYKPDMPTFIRVTLHDFLTAVQNMVIQIESVLVRVTDDKLKIVDQLSRDNMRNRHEVERTSRTQVSDYLLVMLKDSFEKLKNMSNDKEAIKSYVKDLLVLVHEIEELKPTNSDAEIFVQKWRAVGAAFKRMLTRNVFDRTHFLENVKILVSACEEFYNKLSRSSDKRLLVLVKNWIGEFCSVLKHATGGRTTVNDIETTTAKITRNGLDELRKYLLRDIMLPGRPIWAL
ncbi:hypothetical protein FQR65_LT11060 [Abscondita terminalis]|nr:hypothetical protein FQR65_LT11060 [Abscondita terminalis]